MQFFPAVDHAILRAMLFRIIADAQTRWLIDHILNSGAGVLQNAIYRRLSYDLGCITISQQRHAGQMLSDIGRLLGSWQKKPERGV